MLEVQKYLINTGKKPTDAVNQLAEEFGLRVRDYPDRVVLNYCQIKGVKNHPITNECRGLILSLSKDFEILSRTFDRFFNLGEVEGQDTNFKDKLIYEKMDGSLIPIYFDHLKSEWQITTRGTAFGEAQLANSDKTYRELVLETLGFTEEEFLEYAEFYLVKGYTYICEICSPQNRIVTPYKNNKLVLLSIRDVSTGKYLSHSTSILGIFYCPQTYSFKNDRCAVESANKAEGLEEGYVVCSPENVPLYKIKSTKYCKVHLLRGELTFSPKRLASLVINNEQDEYLTYYPEDIAHLTPFIEGLKSFLTLCEKVLLKIQDRVGDDQKAFAKLALKHPFSSILFKANSTGKSVEEVYYDLRDKNKVDLLLNSM